MTVRILGGPLAQVSPLVKFVGPAVREAVYLTSQILAGIDAEDSDKVHVVDTARTTYEATTLYAVAATRYDEWIGENGETFSSALEVRDYINQLTSDKTNAISRRFADISAFGSEIVQVDINTPFKYDYFVEGAMGYFWREQDFPPGVSLSFHNMRSISGIITQAGVYDFQVEISNVIGISTSILSIEAI